MQSLKTKQSIAMLSCVAFLSAVAHSGTANAEYKPSVPQVRADIGDEIFVLRTKRDNIKRGGPIAGIVISSLLIPVGALFFIGGAATVGQDGMYSGPVGAISMAIGFVPLLAGSLGMGFSARNLKRKNQEIEDLNVRIRELEMRQERYSISHGAPQKPVLLRF